MHQFDAWTLGQARGDGTALAGLAPWSRGGSRIKSGMTLGVRDDF